MINQSLFAFFPPSFYLQFREHPLVATTMKTTCVCYFVQDYLKKKKHFISLHLQLSLVY